MRSTSPRDAGPQFIAAAINLAGVYRQPGRDENGKAALGLVLTRLKRSDEAIDEFQRAAELEPHRVRCSYVYAIELHSAGRENEAITVLKETLPRHPADRDTLRALVDFNRELQDLSTALGCAEQLARLVPDDRSVSALIESLRNQMLPANIEDQR